MAHLFLEFSGHPLSWNSTLGAGASTTIRFYANRTGSNYTPTIVSAQ